MFLSVFDIFKIGIGPSSSHTMGPMTGAVRFIDALRVRVENSAKEPNVGRVKPARIEVTLHGSLAFTGEGHATDRAVIPGLTGLLPDTLDPDDAEALEAEVRQNRRITPEGLDEEAAKMQQGYPYPFGSAREMLRMGQESGLSIAQMKRANEVAHSGSENSVSDSTHHLGMTCDPAGGLVQVPCIERNALGAIKAVSAASLALRGDGSHFMPLDNCIETMRQTGLDMNHMYKETSLGGIAVNFPAC